MSIRIRYCIVIVCDVCGEGAEIDEGTPHFENLDQAIADLAGEGRDEDSHAWLMTDREHVCPNCRAKRACEVVGHDWDEWRGPFDARGVPMLARMCWTCSVREFAPVVEPSS